MKRDRDDAGWWRGPAVAGGLSFGLAATMLAGWRWDPDLSAGSIFLLSWALAGVALLGALVGTGRAREAWIGAGALGLVYLVMAFSVVGSSQWPTNPLINVLVRAGDPRADDDRAGEMLTDDEESRRVQQALERPISLHFREGTSLRVFLDRIAETGREAAGAPLRVRATSEVYSARPADLDAIRVSIDCEDLPVRDALRIALGPLGLTHRVISGTLRIYPDTYPPPQYAEDPVMIAGYSLIAMIAVAFGGLAAPMIGGILNRPAG